jgi:hypothetical protein
MSNDVATKPGRNKLSGISPDELGAAVLVHLGSSRAPGHFPGGGDVATCGNCGAPLRHAFVTSSGHVLGGDCLATLCGDDATRSSVARAARKAAGVTAVRVHNAAVFGVRVGRGDVTFRTRPGFVRDVDRAAAERFGSALALALGVPFDS